MTVLEVLEAAHAEMVDLRASVGLRQLAAWGFDDASTVMYMESAIAALRADAAHAALVAAGSYYPKGSTDATD